MGLDRTVANMYIVRTSIKSMLDPSAYLKHDTSKRIDIAVTANSRTATNGVKVIEFDGRPSDSTADRRGEISAAVDVRYHLCQTEIGYEGPPIARNENILLYKQSLSEHETMDAVQWGLLN